MFSLKSLVAVSTLALSASALAQFSATVTIRDSFSVPAFGAVADMKVSCPSDHAALSGGADTDGYDDVEVVSSAPTFAGVSLIDQPNGPRTAADGWQVRAANFGNAPRAVAVSAVCAPLADVVVTINDGLIAVRPGSSAIGDAQPFVACLDGYVAVGGGVDVPRPDAMRLTSSAPMMPPATDQILSFPPGSNPAPIGWAGGVAPRIDTPEKRVKVAAICARATGVTTQISPSTATPAGTHRSAVVTCPVGTIATGGGFAGFSSHQLIMTASAPTAAGAAHALTPGGRALAAPTGWFADAFSHADTSAIEFAVAAICVPVAATPAGAAVTVYEFYNSNLKHYFRTSSAGEANGIDNGSAGAGWQRTGDNFVAFAPGFGSIGNDVCRFYTFGANSHFYTAFAEECDALKSPLSGWSYESIAFRIQLPDASGCAAGMVPVHRLYNNRFAFNDSNHRFTTRFADIAPLQAEGWIYEGVAFCALNHSAG